MERIRNCRDPPCTHSDIACTLFCRTLLLHSSGERDRWLCDTPAGFRMGLLVRLFYRTTYNGSAMPLQGPDHTINPYNTLVVDTFADIVSSLHGLERRVSTWLTSILAPGINIYTLLISPQSLKQRTKSSKRTKRIWKFCSPWLPSDLAISI